MDADVATPTVDDATGRHAGAVEPLACGPIVTRDPAMRRLIDAAESIASSRVPLLIEGEIGTGKGLLARHVHERGNRCARAFVAVGCAARPRDLLARELFGHERDAAAGAPVSTLGAVELARGGTLCLDDVDALAPDLQERLLEVVADDADVRVGGMHPAAADVRVIAITSRRLRDLVDAGSFRADLFRRVSVVTLVVPPLRARPADVAPLAEHLLARLGAGRLRLDDGSRAWLETRAWAGNVRELEHALARAAMLAHDGVVMVADLDDRDAVPPRLGIGSFAGLTVREMERRLIVDTLRHTRNNRTQAAKQLGISIRTLRNKLAEYRTRGELELSPEPKR
jgi:two-component system response regulator FlrC